MTSSIEAEPQLGEDALSAFHSSSHPTNDPTTLYKALHAYSFDSDTSFLSGLASIFGHPGTPATKDEIDQKPDIVLRAQCFYYSRKFNITPPINVAGYKSWLSSETSDGIESTSIALSNVNLDTSSVAADSTIQPQHQSELTALPPPDPSTTPALTTPAQTQPTSNSTSNTQSQAPPQPQPPPPYPTSFAEIVDLITNNKPIPGIEEIPTTVLELGSSKRDTATRRRKPWEKDTETDADVDTDTAAPTTQSIPYESELNATTGVDGKEREERERDADAAARGFDGDDSSRPARMSEMSRYRRKDEGLLRLLRPDAVPDSGLIAKE